MLEHDLLRCLVLLVAGIEIDGLPDLGEQVRLFGEHVLPEVSSL